MINVKFYKIINTLILVALPSCTTAAGERFPYSYSTGAIDVITMKIARHYQNNSYFSIIERDPKKRKYGADVPPLCSLEQTKNLEMSYDRCQIAHLSMQSECNDDNDCISLKFSNDVMSNEELSSVIYNSLANICSEINDNIMGNNLRIYDYPRGLTHSLNDLKAIFNCNQNSGYRFSHNLTNHSKKTIFWNKQSNNF